MWSGSAATWSWAWGSGTAEAAADLVGRAAAAGAAGIVLRRGLARRRGVRDGARRGRLALVELAEQASWAHIVWLLRGVLDRAATDGEAGDAPACRTTSSPSPTRRRTWSTPR